jgi:hypothetical protein
MLCALCSTLTSMLRAPCSMLNPILRAIRYALCAAILALPFLVVAVALIGCTVFWSTQAFAATAYYQWSARIGIAEQYDNNLNLSETNRESDWITLIGPSLTFNIKTEYTEAELAYDLRYAYYLRNNDNNGFRHYLNLSGLDGIPLSEKVTLDLVENLDISEDPIEINEQVTSTRGSRKRYYRNTAGARINYHFGERDTFSVGFNHFLLINNDSDVADSQRFQPSAGITYWFNIRNGIRLNYRFTRAVIEGPEDFDEHYAATTYTHRFTSRTQADVTYTYDNFHYKQEGTVTSRDGETTVRQEDYVVHTGRLGLRHQFTQYLSGIISGGYYFWDRESSKDESQFTGDATLNGTFRLERGGISLRSSTGYRQQFFEAENLGFSRYYLASGTFDYKLLEELSTSLSTFFRRDEYKQTTNDRVDNTWGGAASIRYEVSGWFTVSFGYSYRERDSSDSVNDYRDNRFTINLDLGKAFEYVSKPKPI